MQVSEHEAAVFYRKWPDSAADEIKAVLLKGGV